MERKAKAGINALLVIGIIFTLIGAVFLTVGIVSYIFMAEMLFFSLTFGSIGLVFFVLGVIFLSVEMKKAVWNNRLLQTGNYIIAEVAEVRTNYAMQINGRHPFIVMCQYQDMSGNVHIFKSRNLLFDPSSLLKDQRVKVYVDGEEFKHYYVDIDEILPKVIEH